MQWGILGTSLAVVISTLLPNVAAAYIVNKVIRCKGKDFLKEVSLSFVNTAFMVSVMLVLKNYWATAVGIPEFFLIVILGILTHSGVTYIFYRFFGQYVPILDFLFQAYPKRIDEEV